MVSFVILYIPLEEAVTWSTNRRPMSCGCISNCGSRCWLNGCCHTSRTDENVVQTNRIFHISSAEAIKLEL